MIGVAFPVMSSITHASPMDLLESLEPAASQAIASFATIPEERQRELQEIALFVQSKLTASEPAQVTFICTHNSRRSHLSQVWAQTAAAYYGVTGFEAFSGGTEVTACNERTIAALKRAGFSITSTPAEMNPVYLVTYSANAEPIRSYSKVYQAAENPQSNFLAVMTCDHVDGSCPVVQGAALRVPLHFVDPKVADGKAEEAATYDERSQQIAREMFYLMSVVKH
ncbi:MAG: protein-tyrosine-phosphatase [Roseimicrobium sp.]